MNKHLTLLTACLGLASASLLLCSRAQAGGLYLTDRGARQLGRGGAFVAGTDDGESLWYNPAGLSYTGRKQLYADWTLTLLRASFQRQTRDLANQPPKVAADVPLLPVPTLAYSDSFGLEDWAFGAALIVPNAAMLSWPEKVNGMPGPTRFSLLNMDGSAIFHLALGVAWHGVEGLSIGAGVHAIPARFRAASYLSSCDYGVLCQQPEGADWEAPATVDLERAIAFTGNFGIIYRFNIFKLGASLMLPYTIEGDAKLTVSLPSAPLFNNAHVRGNKAHMAIDMPLVARVGAEVEPFEDVRVEAGVVYEQWSTQKEMRLTPKNVSIVGALGIPEYQVGPVAVPREMQDVFSLRLGAEMKPLPPLPLQVRAGVLFENSAFPDRTLTPMTLDSQKLLLGFGSSVELIDGMWIDLFYAHMFMKDPTVRSSKVYPQNPLRPPPPAPGPNDDPVQGTPEPIGNGHYAMEADFVGGGVRWNL